MTAEWIDGNQYKQRCILSKCEIGDTLYVEAFDCYEKNVYGILSVVILYVCQYNKYMKYRVK